MQGYCGQMPPSFMISALRSFIWCSQSHEVNDVTCCGWRSCGLILGDLLGEVAVISHRNHVRRVFFGKCS